MMRSTRLTPEQSVDRQLRVNEAQWVTPWSVSCLCALNRYIARFIAGECRGTAPALKRAVAEGGCRDKHPCQTLVDPASSSSVL